MSEEDENSEDVTQDEENGTPERTYGRMSLRSQHHKDYNVFVQEGADTPQLDIPNNMFGPSVIYFTFGDGISFKVSSNMMNDMFQRRRGQNFGETGQGLKPKYVQKKFPSHLRHCILVEKTLN